MKKKNTGIDINQVKITSLSHIQGQQHVVDELKLNLKAYFNICCNYPNSNPSFGPVVLTGPPGTGKTLIAKAVHAELGNLQLVESNGVTVNKKSELFSILLHANDHTTVFIDEAQGMNAKSQHILLTALSEKRLYVPSSVSSTTSYTMNLENFTIILATTHEYQLQDALRNRMRIYCRFEYYSIEDLTAIVRQRVIALRWNCESDTVLKMIAQRAKRTPRLALNRNLQTCWNVAQSHDREYISIADVKEAFKHLQIDEIGLDQLDRSYLHVLVESDKASLNVLSSKLSLPSLTIQRIVEPYLLKEGLIVKDNSIRIITQKGRAHVMKTSNNIQEDINYDS